MRADRVDRGSTEHPGIVESNLENELPLPPDHLCERVGEATGEAFHTRGLGLVRDLCMAFPLDFSWDGARVLDFGCGPGRMLRHFAGYAERWDEFWGCDTHEESVSWLDSNLSPPFRFAHNSESPPLPFEEDHFDLIYSVSVFTQLTNERWEGWLKELRRITSQGGVVILSYYSSSVYEKLIKQPFPKESVGMEVHEKNRSRDESTTHAFHSESWIHENWGRHLEVERIVDHGLQKRESIAVLRKTG